MKRSHWLMALCLFPLLSGCKSELYSKLDESEANQMLALLIYNKISADKTADKDGVTLRVEQDRFVDAVEVLRQNGLPRQRIVTMQELFPSGQLVSSPEQEAAKLNYLKSQQLEKMLSSMDGVINAEVSVAESRQEDDVHSQTSAAVFIKYSPGVNLPNREGEILALIKNAIPRLTPGHISLTLQRADYRYQVSEISPENPGMTIGRYHLSLNSLMAIGGTILFGILGSILLWWQRFYRRKK